MTHAKKFVRTPEWTEQLRQACRGVVASRKQFFVRLFKPRFARLVEARTKLQTVRPAPARIPHVGDRLSLREWEGKAYRSPQRILLEAVVTDIKAIYITATEINMQPPSGSLFHAAGVPLIALRDELADRFARSDGFAHWPEMRDWFQAEHGLPFDGVVLYWEPLPSPQQINV